MIQLTGEAEIEFPRQWEYRIIGKNREQIEQATFELCDKPYEIAPSKASRHGNYHSMVLKITVESREEMHELFMALKHHVHITMVV